MPSNPMTLNEGAFPRSVLPTVYPDLIYDIGANNGDDTAYYLARGFRVVSVEADPNQADICRKRFAKEIAEGRLNLLNVAIAERAGQAVFWINDKRPHFNSFCREDVERLGDTARPQEVSCATLDSLLVTNGIPHYLKIDIEGHDIVCLRQLIPETCPPYISVEMDGPELMDRLVELGYRKFQLIDQHTLRPIAEGTVTAKERIARFLLRAANYRKETRLLPLRLLRRVASVFGSFVPLVGIRPRENRPNCPVLSSWTFPSGSSGMFGKDLAGPWLQQQAILDIWRRDLAEYQKLGQEFWCDLHASKV